MISLVDYYQKTNKRLSRLERYGFRFDKKFAYSNQSFGLLDELARIARFNQIEIFACAEECDFSKVGICPGSCIDGELINRIWSLQVSNRKDPTQRAACRCVISKDIGINDTCIYGCPYCYSTRSVRIATKRHSEHDPFSPVLWGSSRPLSEREKTQQLKVPLF